MDILENKEVITWCFKGLEGKSKEEENKWGNDILKKYYGYKKHTNQWTTKLGESLVKCVIEKINNKKSCKIKPIKSSKNNIKYVLDCEDDNYLYEVKTRNWTTSGTAGEKILAVPWKYAEVPKIYGKQIKIILVAFQEYEGRHKFYLFNQDKCNEQSKEIINFHKKMGFEYIPFTDLLKQLGYQG